MIEVVGQTDISYRIKQAGGAVSVVCTALPETSANLYLTQDAQYYVGTAALANLYTAPVTPVTAGGVGLEPGFLTAARGNNGKGVILVEGNGGSYAPLVLEAVRSNGTVVAKAELPMRIAPVEQMMVRADGRGGGAFAVTAGSDLPEDNGKHAVFLHGFSVTPEAARAWHSEMFKRLRRSGSRARYHGVTWFGNDGVGDGGLNYHGNVVHAFETAGHLSGYVEGLAGQKVVMAHSLGNMVVSSAIADHGMSVDKYFMLNAAVPAEAYDSSLWSTTVSGNNMVHEDWGDYLPRTWSALYHQLFDPNVVFGDDDRYKLTWKNRFSACLPGLYNYYSSGDEIFEQYDGTPDPEEGITFHLGIPVVTGLERYSWQKQELYKGRNGMGEWAGLFGTDFAGWGFELVSEMGEDPHPVYTAAEANAFSETDLADPLCVSFRRTPAWMFTAPIAATNRFALLARAISALSGATGSREIRVDDNDVVNVNMNAVFHPATWPRTQGSYGTRWLHSDIKNIAYFYIAPLFDDVVEKGELK